MSHTPRISVPICLGLCAAGAAGEHCKEEDRSRVTGTSIGTQSRRSFSIIVSLLHCISLQGRARKIHRVSNPSR